MTNSDRFRASATLHEATVNICNLRLRTFIGFNPEEQEKPQDVVINMKIRYLLSSSVLEDRVDAALNYKVITKRVIRHVEEGRFLLLEKLTSDVLNICGKDPSVSFARVTVDKPNALRFADSVSLTLEYRHSEARSLRLLEKAS
ncbi:MAG: dihydroneopterin triphosphate 2'-epimerase [Lysobacterales bacterium]|jgi:D-erythro-7,8-dihydroneopterin triphosphate epimerase